jgi:hypothetical protein
MYLVKKSSSWIAGFFSVFSVFSVFLLLVLVAVVGFGGIWLDLDIQKGGRDLINSPDHSKDNFEKFGGKAADSVTRIGRPLMLRSVVRTARRAAFIC